MGFIKCIRLAASPQVVQYSKGGKRDPIEHRTLVRVDDQTAGELPPSGSPDYAGSTTGLGVDAPWVGVVRRLVAGRGESLGGSAVRCLGLDVRRSALPRRKLLEERVFAVQLVTRTEGRAGGVGDLDRSTELRPP